MDISTPRSLYENWSIYTKHIKSPQDFLDIGFYFMIGSCLQRRVWLGSHLTPIFPNLYVILCADPGIGKGLVINYNVIPLLKHHKDKGHKQDTNEDKIEKMLADAQKNGTSADTLVLLRQSKEALEQLRNYSNPSKENKAEKLLFPCGADAITYEALVQQHAKCVQVFHVGKPVPMAPSGIYTYHSMNLLIEEASSLFRKHAEAVVQYLLSAYNCVDYEYKTKHMGADIIKKCSLSLLGGTTPDFMREAFNSQLLGEGFSARTIFVYGAKNRFNQFAIPDFSAEQLACREKILLRLKELSFLFGQCEYSKDAWDFLKHYFEEVEPNNPRINRDPRLKHYYSRKALHVQKLALCIHFADNDSLVIGGDAFRESLRLLDKIEETMHFCLNLRGQNPIAELQRRIYKFLGDGEKNLGEIIIEFFDDFKEEEVDEALKFLIFSDKIVQRAHTYSRKK